MRPALCSQIRHNVFFEGIQDAVFDDLTKAAFLQRFPADLTLVTEGEPADFAHILIEGRIEHFAEHDGAETTLAIEGPPAVFPLDAVLCNEVCLTSINTREPSQVLMIPAEILRNAVAQDPMFARSALVAMARGERDYMMEVKNQKLRSSAERVANWLLRLHAKGDGNGRVLMPDDKRTLAARLGMTPENLSRSFATLAQHGILMRGGEVWIKDMAKLTGFAKPNPLIDSMRI